MYWLNWRPCTEHLPKKNALVVALTEMKKAHPASHRMSFNVLKKGIFSGLNTHSDLSALAVCARLELTPYPDGWSKTGCQGVVGPYPSAFLDKCCGSMNLATNVVGEIQNAKEKGGHHR